MISILFRVYNVFILTKGITSRCNLSKHQFGTVYTFDQDLRNEKCILHTTLRYHSVKTTENGNAGLPEPHNGNVESGVGLNSSWYRWVRPVGTPVTEDPLLRDCGEVRQHAYIEISFTSYMISINTSLHSVLLPDTTSYIRSLN